MGEAKPPKDLGKGKEEIVNIWKQGIYYHWLMPVNVTGVMLSEIVSPSIS